MTRLTVNKQNNYKTANLQYQCTPVVL